MKVPPRILGAIDDLFVSLSRDLSFGAGGRAPVPRVEPAIQAVVVGSRAEFQCFAAGQPPPVLTWGAKVPPPFPPPGGQAGGRRARCRLGRCDGAWSSGRGSSSSTPSRQPTLGSSSARRAMPTGPSPCPPPLPRTAVFLGPWPPSFHLHASLPCTCTRSPCPLPCPLSWLPVAVPRAACQRAFFHTATHPFFGVRLRVRNLARTSRGRHKSTHAVGKSQGQVKAAFVSPATMCQSIR